MGDMKKSEDIDGYLKACKSVVTFPPVDKTVTSKKLIDVWDHSAVNFMVKYFSFKFPINSSVFLSSMFPKTNMSSMYLHNRYDFTSILLNVSSSNSAISNILYGEGNLVPIAVPRFCFKGFSLKGKMLFLRKTSASSTSVEVMKSFSCLRRADRSSSCGMLGYKPTASTA